MRTTRIFKLLSTAFCIVLIAAMALMATGCNDNTVADPVSSGITEVAQKAEVTKIGEGDTKFDFTVVDVNGRQTKFEISTDKTTVGEALLDAKLISGEDGDYGLYVKTVNGTTLDYDKDGMYWSFYINGEYATSGIDTTKIAVGDSYAFKAEK